MPERRPPESFPLPEEQIRDGWFSDQYFVRAAEVLRKDGRKVHVTMQVFQKQHAILCGIDEAIAILRRCAENGDQLRILALYDGDAVEPWETVMHIEGDYASFAHLETVYLGVLARRTAVATSVRELVEASGDKTLLFFGARYDAYCNQEGDGYAAYIGGARFVATHAHGAWWGGRGGGTMPHALIAAYGGDVVAAAKAFDRTMPPDIKRIVLVDFNNDCVGSSLAVARALGERLWGVRLDTSETLCDKSVKDKGPQSRGVCPELVFNVREALDREGFQHVRIVVSGSFTVEKIRRFVELGVPFDAVGVGSSVFRRRIDFTADVVRVEGKPCAKVGRSYRPSPRLSLVE